LLMDIHSQHETLQLGTHTFQLQLIDAYADNQNLRDQYQLAWSAFLKSRKEFETLSSQAETLRKEADYTKFQLNELLEANLQDGEQENLESELKIMEHAEEIKNRFNAVLQLLDQSEYAAEKSLSEVKSNLQAISSFSSAYTSLYQRVESLRIELEDIVNEIEKEESKIEFDPQRSEWIKERLSTLYKLLKKHQQTEVSGLLVLQEELQRKADLTTNLDDELKRAKESFTTSEKNVKEISVKLSDSRKKAFDPLKKQITKLLKELGIPDANLAVELQPVEPTSTGADKVEILFSANKGIAPKPLAQVASGGEFSRVMFCVKYVMAEKTAMPTLVLDEIDNGVSGEIAIKLGALMKSMSRNHQLICITHLPQMAAKGDAHYVVFKDSSDKKTVSKVKKLNSDARVEEIAKMIGGAKPSKVALENAQELLSA